MPRFQTLLSDLNTAFNREQIAARANSRDIFAPGQSLAAALAGLVSESGTSQYDAFRSFIETIPPGIQEGLRATIYAALGSSPPTLITCAWAPGYDFEATYWQAPDTAETRGGISILMKSRYPSDPHPLSRGGE